MSALRAYGTRSGPGARATMNAAFAAALLGLLASIAARADPPQDMQPVARFAIDRTEVTVGQFRRFVEATGRVTRAEREGGGQVYAAGWERRPGWTWRTPYGRPASADEPAVHVTFDEAQDYCRWAGKRLPRDAEWVEAAYTERRASPPDGFVNGRSYPFPTGESPSGANCWSDCGPTPALDHSAVLEHGRGHAPAGTTRAGVNGLFDMGANVWEWVDDGDGDQRRTRGGSWWYASPQMQRHHDAFKPRDMAVVYIGFRCAVDLE